MLRCSDWIKLFLLGSLFWACWIDSAQRDSSLVIGTYASLLAPDGWGVYLEEHRPFQENLSWIHFGDSPQRFLSALVEDTKRLKDYDLFIGLDPLNAAYGIRHDLFEPLPQLLKNIPEEFHWDSKGRVIPFDVGYLALNYREDFISLPAPRRLADLLDKRFAAELLLPSASTSLVGQLWDLYLRKTLKKDYTLYTQKLFNQTVLSQTDSWETAYSAYVLGEASLVLSYTTSPYYHLYADNENHYKAAFFDEGQFRHLEFVALSRLSPHKKKALEFIHFMLSLEAQKEIPLRQWIYPVLPDVPLPSFYQAYEGPFVEYSLEEVLDLWSSL